MKGHLDESQGNYAKALDSYSKALELEPKNASALLSMARLYERQQEKDKAVDFYRKAALSAPNDAAIFADLGSLQARSGNLTEARTELQKAVNLDPKSTSYRSALAGVLLDSGNSEAAMTELQQVNSPAMANYQMAYLHFARKNVPATQQYLGSALQIDPNLKPARDLMASMGGAQAINQMAQRGHETVQQAQGIYQQAGAVGANLQGLVSGAPTQYPVAASAQNLKNLGQFSSTSGPSMPVSSMPSFEQANSHPVPMNR
jgi:Tfp pilus assembly protein PilF